MYSKMPYKGISLSNFWQIPPIQFWVFREDDGYSDGRFHEKGFLQAGTCGQKAQGILNRGDHCIFR